MAYSQKYTEVLKDNSGKDNFFVVGGVDTEVATRDGTSNLFDYVTRKTAIINTNSTLSNKNAFYIVSATCDITFPNGFEGLTIGLKLTSSAAAVNLLPFFGDAFEGGSPILSASDIREYCFVSGTWYRIR